MYPFFRGVLIFIWEKIFIIQKVNFFSFEPLGGMRLTHRIPHRIETKPSRMRHERWGLLDSKRWAFHSIRFESGIRYRMDSKSNVLRWKALPGGDLPFWTEMAAEDGCPLGFLEEERCSTLEDGMLSAQPKWMVGVRTCWAAYVLP